MHIERLEGLGITAQLHALVTEGARHGGEDGMHGVVFDEESFDGVAGGGVGDFCVEEDFGAHGGVSIGGNVDGAEAVGVAEDGDFGVGFDVAD